MKSAPANSPLDVFIKNVLKTPDTNLQPVDWSEVEVLLHPKQKSIPTEINKKTVFVSIAAVTIFLFAFGIFKIIHYYSSLPEKDATLIDSTQNTFDVIDTHATYAVDPIPLQADTTKTDSATARVPADTASLKLITAKTVQKQNKNKKQDTLQNFSIDTSSLNINSAPFSVDTASVSPAIEIKTESPAATDTSASKKISPNKKRKNKKTALPPAEQPTTESPAKTNSDSLKQQ